MRIICLMGKGGAGKSTIESHLEKIGYNRIISYTSRKPRLNEENGKDYYFISASEFKGLIKKGILMEHTIFNNNYYGAPKPVGSINNVIVVETQGFRKIREIYGEQAIGVYIKAPENIRDRIKHRDNVSNAEIDQRIEVDNKVFDGIESEVDLIIDGGQPVDVSVAQILSYIKERK